jgi:hypothetical protein
MHVAEDRYKSLTWHGDFSTSGGTSNGLDIGEGATHAVATHYTT